MRRATWLVLLLWTATGVWARRPEPAAPPPPPTLDVRAFDALLHERIKGDRADLKALANDPRLKLAVAQLSTTSEPAEPSERTALLLNAYAAFALRTLADNAAATKVTDIDGFFSRVDWVLFGRSLSLDSLESDLLRPQSDPRLRAALAFGAVSGPPWRNEAYDPARLEAQLDDQARRLVADPRRVKLEAETKRLWLSPLFRWHARDFEARGGPAAFVRTHFVGPREQDLLAAGGFELAWLPFDWSVAVP